MHAYKVLDMKQQDEGIKIWEVSRSWSDDIDNLLVKGFLTLEVKRTGAATDTSYLFAPVVALRPLNFRKVCNKQVNGMSESAVKKTVSFYEYLKDMKKISRSNSLHIGQ
jgi:hypothetical protein